MLRFINLLLLISIIGLNAQADDVLATSKNSELGAVKVIGSSEQELTQPSSAHFVGKEQLEQQQQIDVNRVLKQVPGVYVQEEDAYGLRPNIGLRGTHPHRSRKIVILEDGILIGPAPYSAPAAYYTPFMSKIESLEVFKGVSSVPYGPNSIGGAINYITRSIPDKTLAELDFAAGNFNTQKYRSLLGYKKDNWALMFEGTHLQTDGFKKLDSGDTAGFKKNDFLIKGQVQLDEKQSLDFKIGYADENSDETYLGLTAEDFANNPYRRYAATQLDNMQWEHQQYQLTYRNQVREDWGLWITGYYHAFHRNWSRVNNFRGGPSLQSVFSNPGFSNNEFYHDVLTGEEDSATLGNSADLVMANNNRYFVSEGLQLGSAHVFEMGSWTHNLTLGLRLHHDQIQRKHTEDFFSMTAGQMVTTGEATRQAAFNKDSANATTLSFTDDMSLGDLTLTANARYETVVYTGSDDISNTTSKSSEDVFAPGVGALYRFTENFSALTGVSRGISVIGPGGVGTKPEESTNYEAGLRYLNPEQSFFWEAIGFYNDYQNIKGTCSFSSGCAAGSLDQEFDGGKARITGLEARATKGFQLQQIYFPISVNMTWTTAQFVADTSTTNPDWGNGIIKSGDPLPYVPELQYSLNIGTQYRRYSQEVVLSWVGEMLDRSVSTENHATPDGEVFERQTIPAHGVVDWTGKYQFSDRGSVYARVDNIFDNEYLVSLRPFGARPGKARSFMLGLKHQF